MRIGVIAPPWVPVPPPSYGGTELVIDLLVRGLAERGHDIILFTTGDATCPVPLAWEYAQALSTRTTDNHSAQIRHIDSAYRRLAGVDLIHDHTTLGPTRQDAGIPVVATMHGVMDEPTQELARSYPDNVSLVAISDSQRDSAPDIEFRAVIHHGLDTAAIPLGAGAGDYLLFLGRMSATKGVRSAIDIAQAADLPLVLAAKICEESEVEYFRDVVEPRLGPGVEFIGEAPLDRKLTLLGDARALLNPIRWREPFGLVMIESLATGTPVIATPRGAAPEIIEHGRTGFLCATDAQAVQACADVTTLSRATCRTSAQERFSAERMVSDHEQLFEELLRDRITVRQSQYQQDAPAAAGRERRTRARGLFARRESCPDCGRPLGFTTRSGLVNLICEDCRQEWHRELGVLYPVGDKLRSGSTGGRHQMGSRWWGVVRHPRVERDGEKSPAVP